jgi:hypothetical protein
MEDCTSMPNINFHVLELSYKLKEDKSVNSSLKKANMQQAITGFLKIMKLYSSFLKIMPCSVILYILSLLDYFLIFQVAIMKQLTTLRRLGIISMQSYNLP